MSSTPINMTIRQTWFERCGQPPEKGGAITVEVEDGMVLLLNPDETEIRLTVQELHHLYQFAIYEAKQQGYEL